MMTIITALDVLDRLLKNKLKLVEDLDQNILSLCDVGSISNEVEESETVLERVVSCQKRIQDILQRRNNESNALENQVSPTQLTGFHQPMQLPSFGAFQTIIILFNSEL